MAGEEGGGGSGSGTIVLNHVISTLADAAELEQLSGFPSLEQRCPAAVVPVAEEEGECGGGGTSGEEVRLPETPPWGRARRLPED